MALVWAALVNKIVDFKIDGKRYAQILNSQKYPYN